MEGDCVGIPQRQSRNTSRPGFTAIQWQDAVGEREGEWGIHVDD